MAVHMVLAIMMGIITLHRNGLAKAAIELSVILSVYLLV